MTKSEAKELAHAIEAKRRMEELAVAKSIVPEHEAWLKEYSKSRALGAGGMSKLAGPAEVVHEIIEERDRLRALRDQYRLCMDELCRLMDQRNPDGTPSKVIIAGYPPVAKDLEDHNESQ